MEETTLVQRAYTAVVEHFVKTGRAPHYTELAAILGLPPEEARQVQHKAAESSIACWFVKDTDYVESWAPFSNVPTHYLGDYQGGTKVVRPVRTRSAGRALAFPWYGDPYRHSLPGLWATHPHPHA